jgi:hypothetical protein
VTNWGIAPPASDPTGSAVSGGSLADGTYKYQITYLNNNTGTRSNGNGTDVEVTTAAPNSTARLSDIPDPTAVDSQITHVEIWRTTAGGTTLFYLDKITAGTTTYDDDGSVSLTSTELPTNNLQPYPWFDDCFGPHNASMFWITRTQSGERGRLYYSPIGRAEAVDGFIEVSSDDDPLQKIFNWQGMLGILSQSRMFQILGTNPYIAREVSGAPGTSSPHTVVTTPYGVVYEAEDGVRLFNGATADLISPEPIVRLFRGDSVENLSAFTGVVAGYMRHEYFISDGSQTLALNLRNGTWRDVGVGMNALHGDQEAKVLAATFNNAVLNLEAEGQTSDNGTAIEIDWEPSHTRLHNEKNCIVRRMLVDVDTNGAAITAAVILDGTEVTVGQLSASSRAVQTLNVGRVGRVIGVRFTANVTVAVEVFGIDFDVYVPEDTE